MQLGKTKIHSTPSGHDWTDARGCGRACESPSSQVRFMHSYWTVLRLFSRASKLFSPVPPTCTSPRMQLFFSLLGVPAGFGSSLGSSFFIGFAPQRAAASKLRLFTTFSSAVGAAATDSCGSAIKPSSNQTTSRGSAGVCGRPFRPTYACPVDMFPHTPHCELMVVFERD